MGRGVLNTPPVVITQFRVGVAFAALIPIIALQRREGRVDVRTRALTPVTYVPMIVVRSAVVLLVVPVRA